MKALAIIDAQNDFMKPDGALYVPGAEKIIPMLRDLVRWAPIFGNTVFYTADDHDGTEPELKANGGPFPPHCLRGSSGQKLVEGIYFQEYRVFPKRCYDVFDPQYGNKGIVNWLRENSITEVVVAGVVGNICVEAAALGLRKLDIAVNLFALGVVWMDLGPENNQEVSLAKMLKAGVKII